MVCKLAQAYVGAEHALGAHFPEVFRIPSQYFWFQFVHEGVYFSVHEAMANNKKLHIFILKLFAVSITVVYPTPAKIFPEKYRKLFIFFYLRIAKENFSSTPIHDLKSFFRGTRKSLCTKSV